MKAPVDDGRCFACGPENPIGLHLQFQSFEPHAVRAHTTLRPEFSGWRGIAHGGIALALLDEAMAHAAAGEGYRGVTASVTARFRKPLPIGAPIVIEGRVLWTRRNVLEIRALVRDENGTTLLDGEGRFVAQGRIDDVDDARRRLAEARHRGET